MTNPACHLALYFAYLFSFSLVICISMSPEGMVLIGSSFLDPFPQRGTKHSLMFLVSGFSPWHFIKLLFCVFVLNLRTNRPPIVMFQSVYHVLSVSLVIQIFVPFLLLDIWWLSSSGFLQQICQLFSCQIHQLSHMQIEQQGLFSVVWLRFGLIKLYVQLPSGIIHATVAQMLIHPTFRVTMVPKNPSLPAHHL